MKTIFVVNNVVVGHGFSYTNEAVITSDVPGTIHYTVDDSNPVTTDWIVTESNTGLIFTPPEPKEPKLPEMLPMRLYMAFSPTERAAIKSSTDPIVQDFWTTFEFAKETNHMIDPNLSSFVDGLNAMVKAKILSSTDRIAEIQQGIQQ